MDLRLASNQHQFMYNRVPFVSIGIRRLLLCELLE